MSNEAEQKQVSDGQVLLEAAGMALAFAILERWVVVPPAVISATAYSLIALFAYHRAQKVTLYLSTWLAVQFTVFTAIGRWLIFPARWEILRSRAFLGNVNWGENLTFRAPISLAGAAVMGVVLAVLFYPHLMPKGRRPTADEAWDWATSHPRRLVAATYLFITFPLLLRYVWTGNWAWIGIGPSLGG
jgi:hypothetical protein